MADNLFDPATQFFLTSGAEMLGSPYTVAPQDAFTGMGNAFQKGLVNYEAARVKEAEEEAKRRQQMQVQNFINSLDPNMPPQQRALASFLAQSGQGQMLPQVLSPPKPDPVWQQGSGDFKDAVLQASAELDLPPEHPAVQDRASEIYDAMPKGGSLVTITNPYEKKGPEKQAETVQEDYQKAWAGAQAKGQMAETYEIIDRILGDYRGGPLGPIEMHVKGLVNQLGANGLLEQFGMDQNVDSLQAANMFQSQIALMYRNPDSGFGLPGATSNRELNFVQRMAPGLFQTQEARQLALEVAKAQAARARSVAEFYDSQFDPNLQALPADASIKAREYEKTLSVFENPDGSLTPLGEKLMALNEAHMSGQTTPDSLEQMEGASAANPIPVTSEAEAEKHAGKFVILNGQVFYVE